jgi:hypothetical protein
MPGGILILDGMSLPQCLAAISRRFDTMLVFEIVLIEADLIRAGVSRESIDALLEDHREEFAAWRSEHLAELRVWLADCNRRLH